MAKLEYEFSFKIKRTIYFYVYILMWRLNYYPNFIVKYISNKTLLKYKVDDGKWNNGITYTELFEIEKNK